MKENLNQRIEEPIQTFAGPPGVPGGTPIYMEEFPAETTNDTTKYNSKNAIWNSGATGGYKNISFANSGCGVQFKAGGPKNPGTSGYPGGPYMGELSVRTKVTGTDGYSEWHEIYHTGNLNLSNFVTTANLNAKADKTYVDSVVASKASTSYVDSAVVNKADKTDLNALEKRVKTVEDSQTGSGTPTNLVNIISAGEVTSKGNVDLNSGKGAIGRRNGLGDYYISVTGLPYRYGVNITPIDDCTVCFSVRNATSSGFNINMSAAYATSPVDCGFYFQVFAL